MTLITIAIVLHGIRTQPSRIELSVILGIIAVYVLFAFRLGAPGRSHLMEYSVLTIFIHKAILERVDQRAIFRFLALLVFTIAFSVGILDEIIQIFLPNRVFDMQDILFNGIAVLMAIGSHLFLKWVRSKIHKSEINT